jgi:hypothetical protein
MNTSNNSISQIPVGKPTLLFTKKNIHISEYGFIDIGNDYHHVNIFNTYNENKQTYDLCISIDDKIYLRVSE